MSTDPMNLLCHDCRRTVFTLRSFESAWDPNKGFQYTTTWKLIDSSVKAGCKWCRFVAPKIVSSANGVPRPQDSFQIKIKFGDSTTAHQTASISSSATATKDTLDVQISSPKGPDNVYMEPFTVYTAEPDPAAKYIWARDRVTKVSSPEAYAAAINAIKTCTSGGHKFCSGSVSHGAALPTRVIDCTDPAAPRIFTTQGIKDRYAALSYVWGGPQVHSLKTTNIDTYSQKIGVALPRTIQDAIVATHNLGLKYLWVDSLCIMQDSATDKDRELSAMRNIYQDSTITISAASAKTCLEGFLQDRPAPDGGVSLPFIRPDGRGVGTFYLREVQSLPPPFIDTRAWCMQERILAGRSLVYTGQTVRFDCNTVSRNVGDSSDGIPLTAYRLPGIMQQPSQPSKLSHMHLVDIQSAWTTVMRDYTARSISYPSDELPALYGVAELFHRFWPQSQYLAGLWRHNLIEDLLWDREDLTKPIANLQAYRAPSWSWASVQCEISPPHIMSIWNETIPHCEILDCNVTLKSQQTPYGEVTGGSLRLRSPAREVYWDANAKKIFAVAGSGPKRIAATPFSGSARVHVEALEARSADVLALPIRSGTKFQLMEGLLVMKDTARGSGSYVRVGMFRIKLDVPGDKAVVDVWVKESRTEIVMI